MAIKAVLFDIDGTLIDSNDLHVRAWSESFHDAGLHFGELTIHDQIGKGSDMLLPSLLPGITDDEREKLTKAHAELFKSRYLPRARPFPGARDLLARVHAAGLKVVLASSASGEEVDHYTDLMDARDIVSATTSASDVEHTKPAPDIFATALAKVAPIAASEAIVVGDTPYDVEAARKCELATIALRSGKFADETLLGAGAIALYDDAAALLAAFEVSPLAS